MQKLLIHQISDEIKSVEKQNEDLLQHQRFLQCYALFYFLAWKENREWKEVQRQLNESELMIKLLGELQFNKFMPKILITSTGECFDAKEMIPIESTTQLVEILNR